MSSSYGCTDIKLIKKGASGATVELVVEAEKYFIRKKIHCTKFKLRQQYMWLEKYSDYHFFPKVFNPVETDEYFSYDMTFYRNFSLLHEYISSNSLERSKSIISSIFHKLNHHFYSPDREVSQRGVLTKYLKSKLDQKVKDCIEIDPRLMELYSYENLVINGQTYLNFDKVFAKVKEKVQRQGAISLDFYEIHGDLTCENILVNDAEFILLDPNQDNLISNIAVEFAKIYQSLHSNYEYMQNINDLRMEGNIINFTPSVGRHNLELYHFVKDELLSMYNLSHKEVLFHEAVHFARMLPYQLAKHCHDFELYYARLIILLNKFVELDEV